MVRGREIRLWDQEGGYFKPRDYRYNALTTQKLKYHGRMHS